MSGESISGLILFIAAMLVAAGVAGTLVVSVSDISGSIDTHSDNLRDTIETDVTIISDAGSSAVYNDTDGEERIVLLVKNTGDRTLPADGSGLDVLVNGEYVVVSAANVSVIGSESTSWRPGEVVRLEIPVEEPDAIESNENRVLVHVDGASAEFEFFVP